MSHKESGFWKVVKVLGIASILMVGALVITIGLAFWGFQHFLHKSEWQGTFKMLDDDWSQEAFNNQFKFGGQSLLDDSEENILEVEKDVDKLGVKTFKFQFSNGKIRLSPNDKKSLFWRCKVSGESREDNSKQEGESLSLDLSQVRGVKCDVKVPEEMKVYVTGSNGSLKFLKPNFSVDLKIGNGNVDIVPDPAREYKYDLAIQNGRLAEFVSSSSPQAIELKVNITNGVVTKGQE